MKILTIVDDYGEKTYGISCEKEGMVYLHNRNVSGWRLRFNPSEGRIEHFNEERQMWDVENAYLYQVSISGENGMHPFYSW